MSPYRTHDRVPERPSEPRDPVGGHGLVLLPLAICSLRLAVAPFESHPPLDELLLALVIAIVCAAIIVVEIRKRHPSATPPEERDEH